MGYSAEQVQDLKDTINSTECDLVLAATPIDLSQLITINKPVLQIRYEYKYNSKPTLEEVPAKRLESWHP